MQSVFFLENRAVLYGPDWKSLKKVEERRDVEPLVDICAQFIVKDSSFTYGAMNIVPTDLFYNLMRSALKLKRDRAIDILLSRWPWSFLSLSKLVDPLYHDISAVIEAGGVRERMHTAATYTTCLVHTFIESLKKNEPCKLQCLDISGYPALPVLTSYLSSHVLLVDNESRQSEIAQLYNEVSLDMNLQKLIEMSVSTTLPPEGKYLVYLDAAVRTKEGHMELCRALQISNRPTSSFKFRLRKLDIKSLGVAFVSVLLEILDAEFMIGVNVRGNSISNEGLVVLVPVLRQLTQLSSLDLGGNLMDARRPETHDNLVAVLHALPYLKRLGLSDIALKGRLSSVLEAVCLPLEYLAIAACRLRDEDLAYLAQCKHAATLCELDIANNNMGGNFERFISVILSCPVLHRLDAEDCSLEATQVAHMLSKVLVLCPELHYCDISAHCLEISTEQLIDSVENVIGAPKLRVLHIPPLVYCYMDNDQLEDCVIHINNYLRALCQMKDRPRLELRMRSY